MEIVVSDTQILIDMDAAGLLELASRLEHLLDINPRLPKAIFMNWIKRVRE